SPIRRPKTPAPKRPAMIAPTSGRKTAAVYMGNSALHHVDVFDGDRTAIAEVDDQDRETDRRLGRGNGQYEHGEDLADEILQRPGERHEVDVHGEQHQLDGHQDDDHILPVEEDAENPDRE